MLLDRTDEEEDITLPSAATRELLRALMEYPSKTHDV
jgi:hypothetical protein